MPCQHTFCRACLKDMELGRKKGEGLCCPSCNSDCQLPDTGMDGLPRKQSTCSFTEMEAITEEAADSPCSGEGCAKPAHYHCLDGCGNICDRCYGLHMVMPFTKKHNAEKGVRRTPDRQASQVTNT